MSTTERPRVLFAGLAAYGAHGGIQRFNRRIVAALEGLAFPIAVVMKEDHTAAMPSATAARTVVGADGSMAAFARYFLREARRSDVLLLGHINLLPMATLFRLLQPRGRIILFAHGIEVWGDPRYRTPKWWEGIAIRRLVDQIAIVSRYSRERMQEAFGLNQAQFSLFPNTVSAPDDVGWERRVRGDTVLVVSRLGANEAEKNIDQLIRAMPKILAAVPKAQLRIIGDGALRPSLEILVDALQVANAVRFDGFVSEEALTQAYDEAALFALPSSKEGFGIVYLEAWLRGLPVIASCHGAGAEIVANGLDGFTVDPTDTAAVADAMICLLTNPTLRARLAAAGLEKLRMHYSDAVLRINLSALVHGEG